MSSEQRGFVFSVTFIIIFAALLAAVPAGLQGTEETPSDLIPVDPSILTEFSDGENYTKDAFSISGALLVYEYTLGGKSWMCITDESYFIVTAKVLIAGILWLGHTDSCDFTSSQGQNRGNILTFSEIDEDAEDGTAQYTLQHVISGESGGGFIAYWNTTAYDNSTHAWDDDELYLLHGVGLETTATNDIGALLVSLLLLQLPGVPALFNIFIAVPIWACIIFVLWYIIKEMIPFV